METICNSLLLLRSVFMDVFRCLRTFGTVMCALAFSPVLLFLGGLWLALSLIEILIFSFLWALSGFSVSSPFHFSRWIRLMGYK